MPSFKGLLLYQDEPELGLSLKVIAVTIAAMLLAGSFYLFSRGEGQGGVTLLTDFFVLGLIALMVTPRSYRVYEDHIRIVLGGPFSVNIGFDRIKSIEIPEKASPSLGVHFATKMTGKYVAFLMKKGPSVSITPKDPQLFLENANRALSEWAKTEKARTR